MPTSLYLILLLISVAFLYSELTKRIPTRLRSDQAPKSDFGLVPVDGFGSRTRANGLDIIFVHGLGSNPDTTWRARKTESNLEATHDQEYVCWVSDFLQQDIPATVRRDIRVFFYNHDSFWQRDAVQTRLPNIGRGFLDRIHAGIRRTKEERDRGLIFVGYSYGGLVIKQALIQASRGERFADIIGRTKAAFFLGTPHRGSSFTRWGTLIARALQPIGSNPSILGELAYDSISLLDLHKEFVAVTGDGLRVVNFFEERKTSVLKLWFVRWGAFCVPEQSATYEGRYIQNIGLSVDHYGLNKFGSRSANYKMVLSKLLETITPFMSQRRDHIYSVSLETVHSYTDRDKLFPAIEEKLRIFHKNSSVPHALAIYGLGGTGKTQLALKYIEDHKSDYNPILWIDAKDPETVQFSFERCAAELQLSVDRASTQGPGLADSAAVQAVLRWLRDRKGSDEEWLFVVDNADDATWGIKQIIPKGERGNVIITSQDDQSPRLLNGGCEKLRVDKMEPLEARALLLQHLKWDVGSAPQHVQRICDTIVERLDFLALAIDLASAYIGNGSNRENGLKQYLADYGKHQDKLLQNDNFRGLSMYDKTVWTVWDTTLAKIEREYSEVRPGLLLAFLAHIHRGIFQDEMFRLASLGSSVANKLDQDIPDWLKQFIKLDEQEWDSYYYRKALEPLTRYSLLQRVDGEWPGVTMHSLVQWRAMRYEENQPWSLWCLIFILAASCQICKEKARPQFRRYMVTHIPDTTRVSQSHLDDMQFDDEKKAIVWDCIGRVYREEGRWKEAEELGLQVVERAKRVLGQEHPDTLISMSSLASTYSRQGRWKEAEELGVQVMETRKRVLGQEHPDTLSSIANLASTYRGQGRWKEAEELEVQVIETTKKVLGLEHPDTLSSMNNLASTYMSQGRWKDAEELLVEVIEIRKRVLEQEHPDMLTCMNNLASTYSHQGRWKEAEELEVQVMETRKRMLGQEHPDTLASMNNLASTYRDQGRWKEAEELGVQVMETTKKVLGLEHPDTLSSMNNLASTYSHQRQWKEAEELKVQVMETRKRVLGQEHPATLNSMSNLASTYSYQGQWKEAEELGLQVIEKAKLMLGQEHPDTLTSMSNLASTYSRQGRWKEAEELGVQVIETRQKVLGQEHPDTLTSMSNLASTIANLASTYRDQRQWKDAEKLLVEVIEKRKRVLGQEHPDTLTSIANLASTYRDQGRWEEAEELGVQVMETRKRVLGQEHPDTLTSMSNLASTYSHQRQWKEAEELLVEVIEKRKRVLGQEHPDTLTSIANLASTYSRQGRWKEAEELGVQVMETRKRVLGQEHPDTLTSMNNLASTYRDQRRWKEAEELGVQVMGTRKRVLRQEHPATLTSMSNLASTYSYQRQWKEAEELGVQVIEARQRVLGQEHPDTLTSMSNLASTYKKQGRWKEAEELGVQVIETRKRVLGQEHPATLTSMSNLASTWKFQGRDAEGLELLSTCVELSTKKLGADHPDTKNRTQALNNWKQQQEVLSLA
ncbi:MAG: hypothetical protein M1816_004381 [Peltula sp. TS41687]|nr:MAG: hypothetical protein M1816_004381 [Peltula sp. TS41687]